MNSAFTTVLMLRQHDVSSIADKLNHDGRTGVFGRFFPTKLLVLKKNNFNCPHFWPVPCVMTSCVHPPISRARARALRLSKTEEDITVHREHTMQPKLGCLLGEEQAREGKSGTVIHSSAALATLRLGDTVTLLGQVQCSSQASHRFFSQILEPESRFFLRFFTGTIWIVCVLYLLCALARTLGMFFC